VIRRAGSARPEAISAERTRSRRLGHRWSGRPTMQNAAAGRDLPPLHVDRDGPRSPQTPRGKRLDHAAYGSIEGSELGREQEP